MWKLAVWESSALSPVIYAEDMFDQCTVWLAKMHLAHPHVLFFSHLCGNLSAYLTLPSLISVSTFKFKGTGATESPHCALFISSIPILVSGSLGNQWCVWPSPQYSGTLTFLCVHIHEWLWYTVEVRGQSQLSGFTFSLWEAETLCPTHTTVFARNAGLWTTRDSPASTASLPIGMLGLQMPWQHVYLLRGL